ncbi:MAG TPA: S24 family peptidase [Candidatus Moranbacteria bacterium]|nr:S24 family peptidase [Candidatus Moranbacteria bacterium]
MQQFAKQKLTAKQRRVYEFLRERIMAGAAPTVTEVACFLGVSSTRTAAQHLEALEKKGLIRRSRYLKRGIFLVEAPAKSALVTLPVVSSAGCDNMEVFAQQNFCEFVTVDRSFLGGVDEKKVVALRAVGESMVEAGIATGDVVLAQLTEDICDRDKVVAVVDGMALIKQALFSENALILRPMSKDSQYKPLIMRRDFRVFGKVIEVIKNPFASEELVYENI